MTFNFDELNKLSADLGTVGPKAIPGIRKAVEVTARHIKDDWKKGAKRSGLSAYASSIGYDLELDSDGSIGAEIGPEMQKRQGRFGFMEDGGSGVRSAPQHAGRKAAKGNESDFVKGLEDAIGDIL